MYTDLIFFYSLLLRVFYQKIVENHKIKKLQPNIQIYPSIHLADNLGM